MTVPPRLECLTYGAQPARFSVVGCDGWRLRSTVPVADVLGVCSPLELLLILVLLSTLAARAALVIPRRYEVELVALPRGGAERSSLLSLLTGQLGTRRLGGGEAGSVPKRSRCFNRRSCARESSR